VAREPGSAPERPRHEIETTTLRKVGWRLIPLLALGYLAAFIDRVNVSFAALQMNRDLGFSATVYGFGAGILFIGYALFEVPSNLILHRVGGRRWLARIMLTWGITAGAMALVRGASGFFVLRFLLGVAEAGFFPGVLYFLTYWVPAAHRARLVGLFMIAIPVSTAIGGPVSSALLRLDGMLGLAGWQWLFVFETIPSLIVGVATLIYLRDTPSEAEWLTPPEKQWLTETLAAERALQMRSRPTLIQALTSTRVLVLGLCYFCADFGLYGVLLWVPQILSHAGISEAFVGSFVALPYAAAAAGMWWWSWHSDLTGERRWHIVAAALLGFCGLAASAYTVDSPLLSVVAITCGAVGTLGILPIFWTLPAAMLSGEVAAGALALINSVGNLGGFTGPYLMGWTKTMSGDFTYGLLLVACGVLTSGLIALLVGEHPVRQPARV